MLDRKVFLAVWMTVLIALAPAVLAQSGQTGTGSQQDQSATIGQSGTTSGQTTMSGEHGEVVQSATEVFRQIRQGGLPSSVLENASAVAVITSKSHGTMGSMHESTPQGTQGSTGTGSQSTTPGSQESMGTMAQSGQSGIVVRRNTDGTWDKTPAFIRWSGGSQSGGMSSSTGSQSSGMGMQSSTEGDLVLVFTGDDSLEALMDGNLDLSSEVTVTSGPTGTTGSTGMTGSTTGSTTGSGETTGSSQEGATSSQEDTTSGTMTESTDGKRVYAYRFNQGSFTGTSTVSGTISVDDSANQQIYGRQMSARELLSEDTSTQAQLTNATLQPLIDELAQAPARAE